jgi:hypothetical protein
MSNELDIDALLSALDNDSNLQLMDLTTEKLNEMNVRVLQELDLSPSQIEDFANKLSGFKFVDELTDLKPGTYMRWISLLHPEQDASLAKGACFCRAVFTDEGTKIVLKNFVNRGARFITLHFDDYLFFYKLTNEERILLMALDHLSTNPSK